jgi:hypothetical protein
MAFGLTKGNMDIEACRHDLLSQNYLISANGIPMLGYS